MEDIRALGSHELLKFHNTHPIATYLALVPSSDTDVFHDVRNFLVQHLVTEKISLVKLVIVCMWSWSNKTLCAYKWDHLPEEKKLFPESNLVYNRLQISGDSYAAFLTTGGRWAVVGVLGLLPCYANMHMRFLFDACAKLTIFKCAQ